MIPVFGKLVDDQTRCTHYHSPVDIVAIRFKCCGKFYPCYRCHDECESHPIVRWEKDEFDTQAVLCGVCKRTLSVRDYMGAECCPHCGSAFNAPMISSFAVRSSAASRSYFASPVSCANWSFRRISSSIPR